MALPRGQCVSPPRYYVHRVMADKHYLDYLTRQAFGDSNTPSGPSSHAPRIAAPGVEVQSTRTAGRLQRARKLASRDFELHARALSEPWHLADPLKHGC
jgi:hypothetical protein